MSQTSNAGNQMPMMPRQGFGGPGGRFMRPVQKPADFWKTVKRLLKFFRSETLKIVLCFLFVLLGSAAAIFSPYYLGKSITALSSLSGELGDSERLKIASSLGVIVASLGGIYICDAISKFAQSWIMAGISQRVVKLVRKSLFDKLQKLPVSYFDSYTHGELMSRLSNDTDNIAGILGTALTSLMSIAVILIGTFIMMLKLSPIMTFFSVVSIPLVFLLSKTISQNTRKLFKDQQAALGHLNAHIEENISGIQVIKAYSHEKYSISDFEEINERLRTVSTSAQIWSGLIMPIMNVINNLSFAIVAASSGFLALRGMIDVGAIASFISYSRQFGRPLNELSSIYNSLQSALASAERVFEILDSKEEELDPANAVNLTNVKGEVEFKNVSFGYSTDSPVLKNVNFNVSKGQTVALVGPTGAGKTTVVNLVTRFYEISEGEIHIDGHNIREYTRDSLRKAFGIVLQDTYLFSGSVMDNIRYGKQNTSADEVINASKMAGAHAFIERLPDKYDTQLTESGQNLSQGQRQLLAIARAILYDPSILILDEATSSVDTRTELKIQQAMVTLMKGRTCFLIAHRLSTILDADMIMVVNGGKLAECGTHSELMALNGEFAKMFEMQIKGVSIDSHPNAI